MDRQRLPHTVLLEMKRWNTPRSTTAGSRSPGTSRPRRLQPGGDPRFHAADGADGRLRRHGRRSNQATAKHRRPTPNAWSEYRRYVASVPGPEDRRRAGPRQAARSIGSFWGEVNSNTHRALGCVGTITDGAIRDVDEMTNAGFKALARRLCVGPRLRRIRCAGIARSRSSAGALQPGQLIHADKHGFLVVPEEDEAGLLEAARFMDANECNTVIAAGAQLCRPQPGGDRAGARRGRRPVRGQRSPEVRATGRILKSAAGHFLPHHASRGHHMSTPRTPDLRQTDLFVSGQGGYHTYRIPSLLATAAGTILAFCEGRRHSASDSGDIDIVLRRSTDDGETWSEMQLVADAGPDVFGNPCPVQDGATGTIWLPINWNLAEGSESKIVRGTAPRGVWLLRSDDDGATWSEPVEITNQVKPPDWTWYATDRGMASNLPAAGC